MRISDNRNSSRSLRRLWYNVCIMNSKTIKLYDENAYEKAFTAMVLRCTKNEKGGYWLILDRTLFFPEEGGQTPDRGSIVAIVDDRVSGEEYLSDKLQAEGIAVNDVQIKDEVIYHLVDKEFEEGATIYGRIDWEHRFSNMQQHTGEHIFSGIVNTRYGYDNVGFHLSDSIVTMDYSGQLSDKDISKVELAVNRAIYENREVRTGYPSAEELSAMDYRSKKELSGAIRIVEVDGYDLCACCAPHVNRTGEIGILKVIGFQNYKGGTRVSILCGRRALEYLAAEHNMITALANDLSTSADCIPAQFTKQQEEITRLKRALSDAGEELLMNEALKLPVDMENVCIFAEGVSDANVIRRVVNNLVSERAGYCGIFFAGDNDEYRFIIGCGKDKNSNDILGELKKKYQVRGGGKPAMVQGSISGAEMNEIKEIFKQYNV